MPTGTGSSDTIALHESEALKAAILETALDCIIVMDHEGLIRDWNPAAERTFGYPRSAVIGTPLAEKIIPPAWRQRHTRGLARYLATGEGPALGCRIEVEAMRSDGSEFPCELAITPIRLGDRPLFTAHLRDITERRQAVEEIRRLNHDLEQRIKTRTEELVHSNLRLLEMQENLQAALSAEQELGEMRAHFISTVSHEFRTPLGIILSSAEILRAHFHRLDEAERVEHLDSIHNSVRQMAHLMEEVLLFHKIEAGAGEWDPAPMDLAELCSRLVDEVHSSTAHRCPIAFEPTWVPPALGDEKLLRHIVINLLTNAVKYSPSGSPVALILFSEGNTAEFRVVDRGIGVPSCDIPKLFQPFRRGSNVTGRTGTGLGLTIVEKCVHLHRGAIALESEEDRGTTVTVTLPLFPEPLP